MTNSPLNTQVLQELADNARQTGIRKKFEQDANRVETFSVKVDGVLFDFSKTHIDDAVLQAFLQAAKDMDLQGMREKMFAGENINCTEDRAVLHTLLRDSGQNEIDYVNPGLTEDAQKSKQQFYNLVDNFEQIIEKPLNTKIKHIVHIGIGGSALGPQMLYESLIELDYNDLDVHFVGNVDGNALKAALQKCNPENTLVIAASKTFTTAETLANVDSVMRWFKSSGIEQPLSRVIAVTANPENAIKYGVDSERVLFFPEWVGGRYSLWSSVSFVIALILGTEQFDEFLKGAESFDNHFLNAPLEHNASFIAALLDTWYVNHFNAASRAIFVYDTRLRSLLDYLQQLETESNGKDRTRNGDEIGYQTSPIVWGGVGTEAQHSVFQMLHQGTHCIPAEFLLVKKVNHQFPSHHDTLLANGVAQTAALLKGRTLEELQADESSKEIDNSLLKAKVFSGNRPSTTIVLDEVTPRILGSLIAFYEHRVFCNGVLADINSYDQMGVELGKKLATEVEQMLTQNVDTGTYDASTQNLVKYLKKD